MTESVFNEYGYFPLEKMQRKASPEMVKEAGELYLGGESLHTLSRRYGRKPTRIQRWLDRAGVKRRSRSEALRLAYSLGRKDKKAEAYAIAKKIQESASELTPAKAYLLGVVGPGDGWISNRHGIGLSSTDFEFTKGFVECIKEVYGLDCKITVRPVRPRGKKPQYSAFLKSRRIFDDILRYGELKHFRHFHERVPNAVKKADLNTKREYLKAFFDSQGWVQRRLNHGQILATKANKVILEEVGDLLSNYGVRWKVCRRRGDMWDLRISDRKSIEAYYTSIGFTIERKQKKLEEMIKRYQLWSDQSYKNARAHLLVRTKEEMVAGISSVPRREGEGEMTWK